MQYANSNIVLFFTDTIDFVSLPPRSLVTANFAGALATVSGWGIAAEGRRLTKLFYAYVYGIFKIYQ